MSTKRGQIDASVEERQPDWLGPTLLGFGMAVIVAVIYQLMVGGIRVGLAGGRLTIDASGLIYWWHTLGGT